MQAAVSGAGVVHRDLETGFAQLVNVGRKTRKVFYRLTFRDFNYNPRRRDAISPRLGREVEFAHLQVREALSVHVCEEIVLYSRPSRLLEAALLAVNVHPGNETSLVSRTKEHARFL